MAISQPSLALRFAHSSLQLALRLWPKESLHWGHALTAELHEIEKPFEAVHWALGGLMLFTRASASHILTWLRLPAGSRLSAASLPLGTNPPLLPKRSRLFTAAVLIATTGLLLLPQSREAISTVRDSWNGYRGDASNVRTLEKLAARAEKQKDARTLAFVALSFPEPERARTLADRAVALDPTLVWIYAARVGWQESSPLSKERLARLLTSDPDNAFPELIAAQVVYEPRYMALVSRHSPTDQETEAAVTGDPQWAAHMGRAFRAPRYDSYFNRDWQLSQEIWNHEPSLPASIIFNGLWVHSIPDWLSIKTYANRLVRNAREASSAGDTERAQSLLRQVDSLGRMMTDRGESDFELFYGLTLCRQSTIALREVYERAGNSSQATAAADRLQQINSRRDALAHSFRAMESPQARMLERRAILVQFSAVFSVLLVFATAFSLLALELRREKQSSRRPRLRGAICLAVDWAPIALLAAFVALLWAFQPFASILRSARSIGSASAAWHTMHFEGLFILSNILGPLFDPFTAYHFWQASICALVALALFILVRGFLRYKRA